MPPVNPDVLGRSVSDCVQFLSPATVNAIKPIQVLADINEKGVFYGAIITYPDALLFEVARKAINKLYKKFEVDTFSNSPNMAIWRNEDKKFTIQLSTRDECNKKVVQVIFISLDR